MTPQTSPVLLIENRIHPSGEAVPIMVLRTIGVSPSSGAVVESYSFFINESFVDSRLSYDVAVREVRFLVESGAMDIIFGRS